MAVNPAAHARAPFLAGIAACLALAVAARFIGAWSGLPAMVVVLAGGMAVRVASPAFAAWAAPGIAFSATQILRTGVALLGFRVAYAELVALGWEALVLVAVSVAATVIGGVAIARACKQPADLAAISATSVAICGASAALAASAAVPRRPGLERETVLVILIVSLLSTFAMLAYPLLSRSLALDPASTAMLLGAAIHDVAQVAGAGFAVSEPVGVKAVTVKMLRVACLLPVVMAISLRFVAKGEAEPGRRWRALRPPTFLLLFFVFAVITSTALLPPAVSAGAGQAAGLLLATAVAAIGLKTGVGELRQAEPMLAVALVAQTLWQLAVVTGLVLLLG